jgi:hypothetical protein
MTSYARVRPSYKVVQRINPHPRACIAGMGIRLHYQSSPSESLNIRGGHSVFVPFR